MTETIASINFGTMLVGFAGGLALFLYGMRKMTEALKLVAGEQAKKLIAKLTTNRFSAAFAGAGVTAIIQSSSITTVLVVGFVSAGVMTFSQSIGVILGANVGTTITAQIIAFKITKTALLLIAAGFFTELLTTRPWVRQFAIMSMGLGMLFFGMELMSQSTDPLRAYSPFINLMQNLNNPVLAIISGAVFTALVQSSSATTGIVIIMASQGFITLETGIALIMGANIGTCVTAYISAIGKPREAMQVAMAHILFNVMGVLLFVLFIPALADLVRQISPISGNLQGAAQLAADTPRQIANAHTVFNVLNLVIFLGFTQTLSRLVLHIVPASPPQMVEIIKPEFIDPYYLDQPTVALDRVRMEITRMGNHALSMVRDSLPVLTIGSSERINSLERRDDEIDILHNAIIMYLHRLSAGNLLNPLPERMYRYLTIANCMENVADLVKKGIVPDSRKRLALNLVFSEGTGEMIKSIYKEAYLAGRLSVEALESGDIGKAREVIESGGIFNGLVERARSHLYARLTQESPEHLAVYKIESNSIENYRRIHHQFMNICQMLVEENTKNATNSVITETTISDTGNPD